MNQHRGVVVAQNGMVAASQPLAVSAGLSALQRGGSFADAAIATSAVLCVTEPYASHLGGDAFLIVYDAATRQTVALNASGAAPQSATPEHFAGGIPLRGLSAASVPGLVSAWFALHQRWGTLPISELLAPALDYARNGFPAGYRYCRNFGLQTPVLSKFPMTLPTLTGRTEPPTPGCTIRQPDLAWTLEQIANGGREAFYEGEIAARIAAYTRIHGALLTEADFAAHTTEITEPIRTDYRGYTVHGQPPVSQGHILLQMLNLIEGDDVAALGHNSADLIHLQTEAKKLAFADRAAYLGDPAYIKMPMETLLSKEYAAKRRAQISMETAAAHVEAGSVEHDTTYFCVADKQGNAVSFIQSVFWGFGCGEVAEGTGILFNNRMTGFSLDPNSPNVLAPGKRTAHTLNAYLLTHGENLAWVGGTPGGDVQVQSNLQVICNLVDFGMNVQEAIEAVRWQHGSAVGAPDEPQGGTLAIESRISEEVLAELGRRGHRVEKLPEWGHASSYQLIGVHPETRALLGGSDPRCDGHAAGY